MHLLGSLYCVQYDDVWHPAIRYIYRLCNDMVEMGMPIHISLKQRNVMNSVISGILPV